MPETVRQAIAGVYTLLRRPSEQKLPAADVRERLNDILRGRLEDLKRGEEERRTQVSAVVPAASGDDFKITIAGVTDFEPVRLEHRAAGSGGAWARAVVGSFDTIERHAGQPYVAVAFYGADVEADGVKFKTNKAGADVAALEWKLTYRVPLLAPLAMNDAVPLPPGFVPMLKLETAYSLVGQVDDRTPDWVAWVGETRPQWEAALRDWQARWEGYLNTAAEESARRGRRQRRHQLGVTAPPTTG